MSESQEKMNNENDIPKGLTLAEVDASCCELGDIVPSKVLDYDIVVVGAGASGVPAAGWAAELGAKVALLQKASGVVSQGNCGSAIIKSRSTEAGIEKWIHHTNSLSVRLACGYQAAACLCRTFRGSYDVVLEPCGHDRGDRVRRRQQGR